MARCKWTAQAALVLRPAADGEDDTTAAEAHSRTAIWAGTTIRP